MLNLPVTHEVASDASKTMLMCLMPANCDNRMPLSHPPCFGPIPLLVHTNVEEVITTDCEVCPISLGYHIFWRPPLGGGRGVATPRFQTPTTHPPTHLTVGYRSLGVGGGLGADNRGA